MSDDGELNLNINLNDQTPESPSSSENAGGAGGSSRFYERYPHLAPGAAREAPLPSEPVEPPPRAEGQPSRFYQRYPHLNPNAQPPQAPVPPEVPTPPPALEPPNPLKPPLREEATPDEYGDIPRNHDRRLGARPRDRSGFRKASDHFAEQPVPPSPMEAIRQRAGRRRRRGRRWKRYMQRNGLRGQGTMGAGLLRGAGANSLGGMLGGAVGTLSGSATVGGVAGGAATAGASAALAAGPVGIAVAGVVLASVALAETFQLLRKEATQLAEQIKEVNGPLAIAYAERQVASFQKDIQIGQRMGSDLANQVRAETELALALRELKSEVLKPLLPLISDLTYSMASIAKGAALVAPAVIEGIPVYQQYKLARVLAMVLVETLKGEIPSIAQIWNWWWNNADPAEAKSFFEEPGMRDFLDPRSPKGKVEYGRKKVF